ncbi:VapE domain-containing protein [Methyloversatilis sp.]|uniref:VapE domain-containing protein n=1 Tax=Methyloversatilis sp. TaxID=2569862 RepID=UPI0035B448FC
MSAAIEWDNIPPALAERRQWLLWRFEEKPGDKKPRKVPYYANGKRRTGKQGDETDRAQLVQLDDVVSALLTAPDRWAGIGFAFLPGDGLIGIDLDKVIDPETGEMQDRALAIVQACASFTEYSPSGTGLHIYVLGETQSAKSNDIGVEVFCGRQFFTVTGRRLSDTPPDAQPISPEVLGRLHATIAQAKAKPERAAAPARERAATPAPAGSGYADRARIESALAYVDADIGYNDWLAIGMALYDALGEQAGLSVWDYWSSKGGKYQGPDSLISHWRSFGGRAPGGDGVIFRLAMLGGWQPPRKQRPMADPPPAPAVDESAGAAPDPEPAAQAAGGGGGEVGPPPDIEVHDSPKPWADRLFFRGRFLMDCRENVYLFLNHHPQLAGMLAADTFARKIRIMRPPPWHSGPFVPGEEWREDHNYRLGMWLGETQSLVIRSVDTLALAAGWVAREAPFNPVQDFVQAVEWDRQERLPSFLTDYLGVAPSTYATLSGTYFWVSLIARIMQPGAVVRSMPILEGPQFQGKSTVVRIIGGQWYSDTPLDLNSKDVYQNIQGVLVYEIAELDAFNKAESTRIKAFISSLKDRFRAPYDREPADHLRQTIFMGTTNQDEYFKDSTGNTRYWPWRTQAVGPIDLEALARDREQLFAEAFWRWEQGERWHPTREEQEQQFEPQQREREIDDPWEAQLEKWLRDLTKDRVTVLDVLLDCLKVEPSKIDNTRQMPTRIGMAMKRLGWERKRESAGARERYWVRPESWKAGAKAQKPAREPWEETEDVPL